MMDSSASPRQPPRPQKRRRVLVLQGGGALGSYQAGAYQALCHHDFEPEWIAGISIGAINAAIIAGNRAREARRAAEGILGDGVLAGVRGVRSCRATARARCSTRPAPRSIATFGVPGFFTPRVPAGAALAAGQPAGAELLRHRAAEDRRWSGWSTSIASTICKTRLRVGAVDVTSGNFSYFDNFEFRKLGKKIGPEHIMASGALPPGFPSVVIDGEHYWDGGIASNTPLDHVLDEREAAIS